VVWDEPFLHLEVSMNFKSNFMNLALITGAMIAAAGQAFAAPDADTIIMHSAVVDTPNDAFSTIDRINMMPQTTPFAESSDVDIDAIVNLGKKAWEIIKANQPVANINFTFANALPQGVSNSSELEGFSDIQNKSIRLWGTNLYGITVYDVTLTAIHQYGGSYDGKGRYLSTVSVIPSHVSVLWGYTVNYSVENVSTTNAGTKANPVAMIALHAKFKVETVIKKTELNTVYQFRGDSAQVKTSGI
jgi:hypothetical protein